MPTDQDTVYGILTDCLAEWERIRIGLLIPGAVWEIKPPCPPSTGFLDGYLTVDFEEWHLHLCIGEHTSAPPEVARLRRTARAELYRCLNPDHQPTAWGFRLYNGGGQQQITVLLPNRHLDERQQYEKHPTGPGCTCGISYVKRAWGRVSTRRIGRRLGFGTGDV